MQCSLSAQKIIIVILGIYLIENLPIYSLLFIFAPDKHQECFNAHQPSLRYATVVKGCELSEY